MTSRLDSVTCLRHVESRDIGLRDVISLAKFSGNIHGGTCGRTDGLVDKMSRKRIFHLRVTPIHFLYFKDTTVFSEGSFFFFNCVVL